MYANKGETNLFSFLLAQHFLSNFHRSKINILFWKSSKDTYICIIFGLKLTFCVLPSTIWIFFQAKFSISLCKFHSISSGYRKAFFWTQVIIHLILIRFGHKFSKIVFYSIASNFLVVEPQKNYVYRMLLCFWYKFQV